MTHRGSITLGPGGVLYLVVAALILAAAIYTQANLLFAAFGLVMGGLVVSAGWSLVAMRGLEVRRELPSVGVAGRAMVVRYHVYNRSRLPAFSVVIEEQPGPGVEAGAVVAWLTHVGPGQRLSVEAPCWPSRRGELWMSGVEAWTAFPFGVLRRSIRRPMAQRVLVLPSLRRIDRRWLPTSPWSAGYGAKQRGGASDAGEFYGLRDYREGDPPRVIDWKRSARMPGELHPPPGRGHVRLVARELTQPTPPRLMVLLDLSGGAGSEGPRGSGTKGDEVAPNRRKASRFHFVPSRHSPLAPMPWGSEDEEDAITLAASLVDAAHRQGFWFGLAVIGPGCPVIAPHQGLPHRARMLEALARLDLSRRGRVPRAGMIVPSVVVKPGQPPEVIGPASLSACRGEAGAGVSVNLRSARVLYGGELRTLGAVRDSETVDLSDGEWAEALLDLGVDGSARPTKAGAR